MNLVLDPNTVIGDCLETALGLPTYVELINSVKDGSAFVDETAARFQKTYNAFYRVRQRSPEWYKAYYRLMREQVTVERTFEAVLRELLPFGMLEVSFASKLLATVAPNRPIWDQYVIKALGMDKKWAGYSGRPREERLKKAVELYDGIEQWYAAFLNCPTGKACIARFDEILPNYATRVSDVKKVDYMLVSRR